MLLQLQEELLLQQGEEEGELSSVGNNREGWKSPPSTSSAHSSSPWSVSAGRQHGGIVV